MIPEQIPLKNNELFRLAVTHRSATTDVVQSSYERLEFFGDAILGFVIAQYLYEHHPDWNQGMLSKARSSVVQEGPLAEASLKLKIDDALILGPGEESTGGRSRPSILADVFESIVGAIYLESGMEKARWFILEQLQPYLEHISTGDVDPYDFKSKLQVIAQDAWRKTPAYRLVKEEGHIHSKIFTIQVLFDNEIMGEATGRSRKEAEHLAAKNAMELIRRTMDSRERYRRED